MKFVLPLISLAPLPLFDLDGVLRKIHEAHFTGIEVLLGPKVDHAKIRTLAQTHGLSINWHEIWSLTDNPTHHVNYLLAALGRIPWKTHPLNSQLPLALSEPVVCYGHRIEEVLGYRDTKLLWLQTCKVMSRHLPYKEFVKLVQRYRLPIVFDTQHVLEWMCDANGVTELGRLHSSEELQRLLLKAWDDLSPYTEEIHVVNFKPQDGHTRGRNIFLNEGGVLKLREFGRVVKKSDWNGTITPEIAPAHFSTLRIPGVPINLLWESEHLGHRLLELREIVGGIFS